MSQRLIKIRNSVRHQLLYYLREAEQGNSELLMKEVWEECGGDEDLKEVTAELGEIIKLIEARIGLGKSA